MSGNMSMSTPTPTPTAQAAPSTPTARAPLQGTTPTGTLPTLVLPLLRKAVAIQVTSWDAIPDGDGNARAKEVADGLFSLLYNNAPSTLFAAVKDAFLAYDKNFTVPASPELPTIDYGPPKAKGASIPDGLVGILERAKEHAEAARSEADESAGSSGSALDASLQDAPGYVESAQYEANSASGSAQEAVDALEEALGMIEEAPTAADQSELAETLRTVVDALDPHAERTADGWRQTLTEAREQAQQALETIEAL